ncbi:thymidylate kinase family protein (plasmid) [Clostridium baratii str. Sullivan]|uniref:Thymidylate kinase n=1 Tax=Clostridium baratii str. Sullivan TaxID=1415775 RepID=A0A0A7G0M6_9CLOT|nr:dTMP kinase [Clostridium baratii]AIY85392.1 thymidylate kinase family protein [Clostridium baratii str. Sullivan]
MDKNSLLIISFEGLDTSGKSSQIKALEMRLKLDGIRVKSIHFPNYDSKEGLLIKEKLHLGDKNFIQHLYILDQLRFFLDDTIQSKQITLNKEFDNIIKNYDVLLIDRYEMSTLAYYMASKENFDEAYRFIKELQKDLPKPNMTFILDLPATEVVKRKKDLDSFESNFKFMSRIRNSYKMIPMLDDSNRLYITIDACQNIDYISNCIYKSVKNYINDLKEGSK